jgi:uncharacterized protein involved in exopolysaccharide biosynthesis
MNHDSSSFEDELSSVKADVAVIRSDCVTKADLQEVRIELKAETQAVKSELKADISALKENIDNLRIEVAGIRTELHKAISAQTWKLVGFASALVVAAHFASRVGY